MDDSIFITNIKASVDENSLRTFFSRFGKIIDFKLQPDLFNDCASICNIKFSKPEEASLAIKQGDKSTTFGDPLRVSYKKNIDISVSKSNGVGRVQSFGRGRGIPISSPISQKFTNEVSFLKDLILPLEKKCNAEIIELKTLSNILVRPLQMTDTSLMEIYKTLGKLNDEAERLGPVRNPEVNGYYLAKWNTDDKFYRAKILKKLPNSQFEVCFVDEGTCGDIVTELRAIPDTLLDMPCQFLACTINCQESKELIDLVLKEGSTATISVYLTSNTKVDGKCLVNIFLNDQDIIDLFKRAYNIDPRNDKVPTRTDIKSHILDTEFADCQVSQDPEKPGNLTVVLDECIQMKPKFETLKSSPLLQDLLIYKEEDGHLHRCLVHSYKFDRDRLSYSVFLIDRNRYEDATSDNLFRANVADINFPMLVIKGVSAINRIDQRWFEECQTVILTNYDIKKDLYTFKFPEKCEFEVTETSLGQIKTVIVSHVEQCTDFYVQMNEDMSTLDMIQEQVNGRDMNTETITHVKELKANEVVIGPFESIYYRALVRDVDLVDNIALLFFMDFGNSEWVVGTNIMRAPSKMGRLGPMAHKCGLSLTVREEYKAQATEMLIEYCDRGNQVVHMKVDGIDEDGGWLVSLTGNNKRRFEDILEYKGLLSPREVPTKDPDNIQVLLARKIADLELRIASIEDRLIRR